MARPPHAATIAALDQRELQLVAPLVQVGALPADAANECLRIWQTLLSRGQDVSLLQILVKKGLMTRTQARMLLGQPLERFQPFDGYKLLRKAGEGGMADVYEATYLPLSARVALKVLKTEYSLQDRYRLRFRREANILLNLRHPNIVEGREYASGDGVDFYAMGFVDGISVLDLLDHDMELGEGLALHVACQIGSALQHMHEKGVVHRDIKPGNIVLDRDGTARVIDFGLAKFMRGMQEDTAEAMTVGTPEYMSPEQARGDAAVDTRADIYSLGASLYHMLLGDVPFHGSPEEILIAQVKQELVFSAEQMRTISPPVLFVVRKAMAKDPALRYSTPQEMVDDIHAVAGPIMAARDPVPEVVSERGIEAAPIDASSPFPRLTPGAGAKRPGRRRPGRGGRPRRR